MNDRQTLARLLKEDQRVSILKVIKLEEVNINGQVSPPRRGLVEEAIIQVPDITKNQAGIFVVRGDVEEIKKYFEQRTDLELLVRES